VWAAALLWSLLPLARSEGFVIMPLLGMWFLWHREWIKMWGLAAGVAVYSILGAIFLGDAWWLLTQSPYHPSNSVYGSGTWNHFLDSYQHITHMAIGLLFLGGLAAVFFPGNTGRRAVKTIILSVAVVLVFTLFHSTIWALGLGSFGLIRVFAAIVPFLALPAVLGLDRLSYLLRNFKIPHALVLTGFMVWIIILPFTKYKLPLEIHAETKAMAAFAEMMKSKNHHLGRLYYYDPALMYLLHRDPWNFEMNFNGLTSSKTRLLSLQTGDMVVWDAHYGPTEGHTPPEFFESRTEFELIEEFKTDFNTLNDRPYIIRLYRRL
jgi:hypothetical protein